MTVAVTDTLKKLGDLHVHVGRIEGGPLRVGDAVELAVDAERRTRLRRAHSATHLLHAALRRHLGTHVTQKGSLVAPDRLRFDFSQPRPVTADELRLVEAEVNFHLRRNEEARVRVTDRDAAIAEGAMALFGEKYGDQVRVVSMGLGEDGRTYSVELCGGTHVGRTGDIALFRITGEGAVAAGVRRIEALTGEAAFEEARREHELLADLAQSIRVGVPELPARIEALVEDRRRLEREVADLRRKLATGETAATASSRWARSASPAARWTACRPRSFAAPRTRSRSSSAPASWRWSASTTARPPSWSASPTTWPSASMPWPSSAAGSRPWAAAAAAAGATSPKVAAPKAAVPPRRSPPSRPVWPQPDPAHHVLPYPLLDWQSRSLAALLNLPAPWPGHPGWAALRQLLAQTLAATAAKEPSLEAALRVDAGWGVASATVLETPFVHAQRFRRGRTRRRIVLLAPHSGYAASVLSPLVAALLSVGEVWVTDWRDARLVPASAGGLDLAQQTGLAAALLAADSRPAHLVAFSQSGPALLMAAALSPARAASTALLGSPIDAARSPTPLQRLLAQWPRAALIARMTGRVPHGYPGVGRPVYPGLLQLLALSLASPESYLGIQQGLLQELLGGDDRGFRRIHADLHSVIDVPAELFADMLDWAVYRPALAAGAIHIGTDTIPLAHLAAAPLLTVEAAADELIGPGQTHAAAQAIGHGVRHVALDLPGAGHSDLFTGPLFLRHLAPALLRFITEAEP